MRGVHRSLKRNWILDAYALSNSNLTFLRGERGRGFTPPFLLVFASSISSLPSRSTPSPRLDYTRFQFHPSSIIPIALPPITPFNSTLLNSNSSLPFPFFDRIPLSIPFPFPPSITLAPIPISLRLHPLCFLDYNPPRLRSLRLHPFYLSLYLSIHSFDRDGCRGHESKVQNSVELRGRKGENLWTVGDPRHLFPASH